MNKNAWLNTTVFYNINLWHNLISDCISQLFFKLKSHNLIYSGYVHFNRHQGDHIRISVSANYRNLEKIKSLINEVLSQYLSFNPSPLPTVKYPLNTIFKNFPNNSVNYNIYKNYAPQTDILNEHDLIALRELLTEIIFDSLVNEPIGEENVFTFCLYLQTSILRGCFQTKKDCIISLRQQLNILINNTETKSQVLSDKRIFDLTLKNIDLLQEINKEIWNELSEANWLKPWTKKCEELSSSIPFEILYPAISLLIAEHVCYMESNGLLITTSLIYTSFLTKENPSDR